MAIHKVPPRRQIGASQKFRLKGHTRPLASPSTSFRVRVVVAIDSTNPRATDDPVKPTSSDRPERFAGFPTVEEWSFDYVRFFEELHAKGFGPIGQAPRRTWLVEHVEGSARQGDRPAGREVQSSRSRRVAGNGQVQQGREGFQAAKSGHDEARRQAIGKGIFAS